MWRLGFVSALTWMTLTPIAHLAAQVKDRNVKVRDDRQAFVDNEHWIYNDLDSASATARANGKPLFVVFRCIPCEACAGFDDRIARRDPAVRALLDDFVCVRVPQANTLDLSRFQFDFDLSLGAFFMNADGTLYGRFGTPTERHDLANDASVQALVGALEAAKRVHAGYPQNRDSLTGKQSAAATIDGKTYKQPQDFPKLASYQTALDWEGAVAKSCVHCHQLRDAERLVYREAAAAMPEALIYPWPMPNAVGLALDPAQRARVQAVSSDSPAAAAGFQVDDILQNAAGQVILSIADVQWVLHRLPDNASTTVPVVVERSGQMVTLTLSLPRGWRQASDISWRVSTWELRRMALGGLVLEPAPAELRTSAGVGATEMALRVKRVGQFGGHAVAKQAGFREGDVIVSFGGRKQLGSEAEVLAYAVAHTKPNEQVEVIVWRDGGRETLTLKMQ